MSFLIISHLAALRDCDVNFGFVVGSDRRVLDLPQHQHAVDDTAEHDVLAVEEITLGAGQKELTAIGVLSTVGH